jgi:Mycothiol-dependent nitroreductase Rv2466c
MIKCLSQIMPRPELYSDQAIAKAGTDVGVAQIVLDGGKGPGFFGPVMSPAPTGEEAVKFWNAIIAVGSLPGFFELKRTREVGPIFGERPKFEG